MVHLQLVTSHGRHVDSRMRMLQAQGAQRIVLSALSVHDLVRMRDGSNHGGDECPAGTASDARRFVLGLSARNPVGEIYGVCPWDAVADILAEIMPIFDTFANLQTAAEALRFLVSPVLEGEDSGAGMQLRNITISILGNGAAREIDMHVLDGKHDLLMKFSVTDRGATLVRSPA